jgi:GNAT superfamily N-acetyltransferase
MDSFQLRAMRQDEWDEVAELICYSTNCWYERAGKPHIFASSKDTIAFCEIYEALDPGCCVVAEDSAADRLAGSCFFHPRQTHWALGIMNVHPDHFGRGIARRLLAHIIEAAEREDKPLRLVSSAMNLDSFSLYTRAGFVPRRSFQDMMIDIPATGLPIDLSLARIRPAEIRDVPAMAELEMEIAHIRREKDYRFFIENAMNIWHTIVSEDPSGAINGFLTSIHHPAVTMLGPGVARSEDDAFTLIVAQLNHLKSTRPVFLVPCECASLVPRLYAIGCRNCELHFAQVRGRFEGFNGVVMPTFMPETG